VEKMPNLFLIRGVSGAGKTTFAKTICKNVISADDYFTKNEVYHFDPDQLHDAHKWCQVQTKKLLSQGLDVAVANTFTQFWEMEPYYKIAEEQVFTTVFSIIVENRHGSKNTHNVPETVIAKQRRRFEVMP